MVMTPSEKRGSTGSRGGNPLKSWAKWWKERGERLEAQAAADITEDRSANEQKIRKVLGEINFITSPIPKEELDHKENPNQPYGDLEYNAKGIMQAILSTRTFPADTREIDTILLELATQFSQAINQGDVTAAHTAKAGMVKCILEVRNQLPDIPDDRAEAFVASAVKYMKTWPLMTHQASVLDKLKKELADKERVEQEHKDSRDSQRKELRKLIDTNADYADAMAFWDNVAASAVDPKTLTPEQLDVRKRMTQILFEQEMISYSAWMTETSRKKTDLYRRRFEMLRIRAAEAVIDEDPNAIEKYNELIDDSIENMNRVDVEIAEQIARSQEVAGRLDALKKNPGQIAMNNAVITQTKTELELIREDTQKQMLDAEARLREAHRKLGIPSAEEIELAKQRQILEDQMQQQLYTQQIQQEIEAMRQAQAQQEAQNQQVTETVDNVQTNAQTDSDTDTNYNFN